MITTMTVVMPAKPVVFECGCGKQMVESETFVLSPRVVAAKISTFAAPVAAQDLPDRAWKGTKVACRACARRVNVSAARKGEVLPVFLPMGEVDLWLAERRSAKARHEAKLHYWAPAPKRVVAPAPAPTGKGRDRVLRQRQELLMRAATRAA